MGAATFNPSDKSAGITLSNGNLTVANGGGWQAVRATIGKSTGKWYWEVAQSGTRAGGENMVGVATADSPLDVLGGDQYGWVIESNGKKRHDNSAQSYGDTMEDGDVYCIAIDLDAGKLWAGKNGTWNGDPAAGTDPMYSDTFGTVFPGVGGAHSEIGFTANFGDSAFAYTVPSGFNSGWSDSPPVEADTGEYISIDDSFTTELMVESTSEEFSISDSFSGDTNTRSFSENLTFSDNLSAPGSTYSTTLSEAISFSDSIIGGRDIFASISEELSFSDSMVPLSLSEVITESISFSDSMDADEQIWIKQTFPNLSGKHLTLKFVPTGSALYFTRMKMFKTVDRVDFDARHPNLSGYHLALKISHTANEEFTLAYASMELFGKIE
jgi:hypothetical protein